MIRLIYEMLKGINKNIDKNEQLKEKDRKIEELTKTIEKYNNIELTLNKTILMAENTSNEMKKLAKEEAENLISDAKKNASRIVNEALLDAEKTQIESIRLKKNIVLFKKKLKIILENQIEMVEEIDNVDL